MTPMRRMTQVAVLSAVGVCLMLLVEVPLFPLAPYLKYDAGDLPVLVGAFALGPASGVAIALLKNLLYLLLRGTPETWFVGVPMNLLAGASFAAVAGYIYSTRKTKVRAVTALALGGLVSTAVMFLANMLVLPVFLRVFLGAPTDVSMHMLLTVIVPFNLLKAAINGVLVFFVYKRVSPVLKAARWDLPTPAPRPRASAPAP